VFLSHKSPGSTLKLLHVAMPFAFNTRMLDVSLLAFDECNASLNNNIFPSLMKEMTFSLLATARIIPPQIDHLRSVAIIESDHLFAFDIPLSECGGDKKKHTKRHRTEISLRQLSIEHARTCPFSRRVLSRCPLSTYAKELRLRSGRIVCRILDATVAAKSSRRISTRRNASREKLKTSIECTVRWNG